MKLEIAFHLYNVTPPPSLHTFTYPPLHTLSLIPPSLYTFNTLEQSFKEKIIQKLMDDK